MVGPGSVGATVGVRGSLPTAEQQSTLADRIRNGEPSAEEELVHLFRDRIGLLVRMRTHDADVARDLTQDILLAVVLALRDGHLRERERLAAFVYGTARNLVNNYLRARNRAPTEDPIDERCCLTAVRDPIEDIDRSALVRRALASLDTTDRQILLLTLVEGLKPGEIACRLRLSPEVVRAHKSRALKKLVDRVEKLSRP